MTASEIYDAMAAEIVADGQPFDLYWSGGLDSTPILCALFKAGIKPEQMRIMWNSASAAEYPWFAEKFVEPWLNKFDMCPSVWPDVNYEHKFITGELGDQICGSVWITLFDEMVADRNERWHSYGSYIEVLTRHWHAYIKMKYPQAMQACLIDMYEPLMACAPFRIVSIYDFLWWVNFSCKWQHVYMRMAARMPNIETYFRNNTPFYADMRWQQWSMNEENHRTKKTGTTVDSYKQAFRDYIVAFTKDEDYVAFKKKVGSLPMKINRGYLFVLEDGTRVRYGGFDCMEAEDCDYKHGDKYDYLFNGVNEDG